METKPMVIGWIFRFMEFDVGATRYAALTMAERPSPEDKLAQSGKSGTALLDHAY